MIYLDEKKKQFNKAIKNKDLKEALIAVSQDMKTSRSQELKLFELTVNNNIFKIMDDMFKEGLVISDKYLALTSIYFNVTYFWDIGLGTNRGKQDKYPYLTNYLEKRIEEPEYCRTLFVEWKNLFEDMINQKTVYKVGYIKSEFYYYPHDYEAYVIERSASTFLNIMFKESTKEEILKIMLDCRKYPKVFFSSNEIDKLHNEQNSRYRDVQYFSHWLSQKALPLIKKMKNKELMINSNIPLVSQCLIQEIKLIYKDLMADKSLLEQKDWLIVEKLYHQRLPELLEQYEAFDHKNYHDLKNHNNKNISELLFQSLSEVHSMFESFNEKINIKKIENLSFSVKLTKEYIKHNF